jgi:hypothetical protein
VCDFENLQPGIFLSREAQQLKLLNACGIRVTATEKGSRRDVNVFNSSDIKGPNPKYDPDLGTPNKDCPGGGPGVGDGGRPNSPFPNCVSQNNLLIIQDEDHGENTPNDSPIGGCFIIEFERPVTLINMGLLDMEESPRVSVRTESPTVNQA